MSNVQSESQNTTHKTVKNNNSRWSLIVTVLATLLKDIIQNIYVQNYRTQDTTTDSLEMLNTWNVGPTKVVSGRYTNTTVSHLSV